MSKRVNISKAQSILVVLFFLSFGYKTIAQNAVNYMPYYELCNEAKLLSHNKEYKKALEKYEEAFVNYKAFEDDNTEAVKAALHLNNPKKVYQLLKIKMISNGWFTSELFEDSVFNLFLASKYGKKYIDERKSWEQENKKTIDPAAYGFIRSVDATDQYTRSGFNKLIKTYVNDSVFKLFKPALIEYTDSVNFIKFKKYITTFGFPGRTKTGGKDYLHTFIIHILKYQDKEDTTSAFNRAKFKYLDSVLLQQIAIGEFSPWHYAYAIDYSLSLDKISMFGVNQFYKFPIVDMDNLEKRRKAIGLMSLKQQCTLSGKPLPSGYKE